MGLYPHLPAFACNLLQIGLVDTGVEDQVSALPGEGQCDLSADISAGTGDEGCLSFQSHFSPFREILIFRGAVT